MKKITTNLIELNQLVTVRIIFFILQDILSTQNTFFTINVMTGYSSIFSSAHKYTKQTVNVGTMLG